MSGNKEERVHIITIYENEENKLDGKVMKTIRLEGKSEDYYQGYMDGINELYPNKTVVTNTFGKPIDYKGAYNILMDNWDAFPKEQQEYLDEQLKEECGL